MCIARRCDKTNARNKPAALSSKGSQKNSKGRKITPYLPIEK